MGLGGLGGGGGEMDQGGRNPPGKETDWGKHHLVTPVQFEKPLVSASYRNLVWNLALINLAKQKLHIWH